MKITNKTIETDIAGFQNRISEARTKLAELPASATSWAERKKLGCRRRELESEIKHVRRLSAYARESLAE